MRAVVRMSLVLSVALTIPFVAVAETVRLFPGVARASGANGTVWRSEGVLFNPGPATQDVTLQLLPRGGGPAVGQVTLVLQPGETRRINDVYSTVGLQQGAGMLRVTGDVAVWLRTFNKGADGTFGQDLPEVDPAAGVAAQEIMVFPFSSPADLRKNFRSNLMLVNLESRQISALVRGSGKSTTLTVPAGAYVQLDDIGGTLGVAPGFAIVKVSADGRWDGVVSTVDAVTGDPTTIRGLPTSVPRVRTFDGVARAAGANDTSWRSEVVLANASDVKHSVELALIPRGASQVSVTKTLELTPGATRRIADLYDFLGVASGAGSLRVTGDVLAWVRTYNQGATGSFGQDLPPVTPAGAFRSAETVALPISVTADIRTGFRSNLLLRNLDSADVKVSLRLGDRIVERRVAPGTTLQLDNVGNALEAPVGAATVWASADGAWTGTVSTVDPDTGDPTTLRAVRGWHPPSSADLIAEAVDSGRITTEQALIHRVFAEYGDQRLPAELRGDDRFVVENDSLGEAVSSWSTLSPATRTTLGPFMAPPFVAGSWWDLTRTATARKVAAGPACRPWEQGCPILADWESVVGTNLRVWYLKSNRATDHAIANDLVAYADGTIWPALSGVMGRLPLPDGTNGVGPEIDVALVDGLPVPGRTRPAEWTECKATPVYILMSRSLPTLREKRSVLAHELLHAVQFGINTSFACVYDARWLMESTASWFEDRLDATLNRERYFASDYLAEPQLPLDDESNERRMYGGYLFFFSMTKVSGVAPEVVGKIWDATITTDAVRAIDSGITAVGKSLATVWKDFAVYSWNQAAPFKRFNDIDGIIATAKIRETTSMTVPVGEGYSELDTVSSLELPHLSIRYYEFDFPDKTAASVAFHNGLAFSLDTVNAPEFGKTFKAKPLAAADRKGIAVQALLNIGGTWRREDWSGQPFQARCRDEIDDRITSMVVIVSNSDVDATRVVKPRGKYAPLVFASNYGCGPWEGGADMTYRWGNGVVERMIVKDVRWEPVIELYDSAFGLLGRAYSVAAGNYTWTISGSDGSCSVSGQSSGPLVTGMDTMIPLVWLTGGGGYRRFGGGGYYRFLTSPAEVTWSCPDGGYTESRTMDDFMVEAVPVDDAWSKVSADGRTFDIDVRKLQEPGLTGVWRLYSRPDP